METKKLLSKAIQWMLENSHIGNKVDAWEWGKAAYFAGYRAAVRDMKRKAKK